MRIEGGSQNASRIPGVYAYPVWKYNNQPVESVNQVRGNSYEFQTRRVSADTFERSAATADLARVVRERQVRENPGEFSQSMHNRSETTTRYENTAFGKPEGADRGLFLNILG